MKIGMLKGMQLCRRYEKLNREQRAALQKERLAALVAWAKEKSPLYRELYKDVPPGAGLAALPPVSKARLMPQFDRWVTDPAVRLADLEAFMREPDNIGRLYAGRYLVLTTSGSTGTPLVVLCDKTTNNMMGAINTLRSFARGEDMRAFVMRGGKSMGVFATGGFYLSNSSVRARLLAMPWKKNRFAVSSALLPVEEIVAQLNRFQPVMLGGYPSNLALLIPQQEKGNLHISPSIIMTGGEYLPDAVRQGLAQAFGCYVQTSYSCTEAGPIACECGERHFHVNDDWVIVEPVDRNNRPVADGVQADKILLTNLFNFTQPFLRYEITDRVVMHHEPCPCGNPSPWLTVEGRTDDTLHFMAGGRDITVPPLALYATLINVKSVERFQLVAHGENELELRVLPAGDAGREAAFAAAKEALSNYLAQCGVCDAVVRPSDVAPQQMAGSGKFKHIIAGG